VRLGFEGGQTPLYLRLPKFGFNRKSLQQPLEEVTLGRLQLLIDQGRIDTSKTISVADIKRSGAVSRVRHGVKLLAKVRRRTGAQLQAPPPTALRSAASLACCAV